MESTGVYWKPVWNVLEASKTKFELVLVNPQHIKALPAERPISRTPNESPRICRKACCEAVSCPRSRCASYAN